MAVKNFIQTIWSKKIQDSLEMKTKLVDYCTRDYEGDCKFAKTVVILGVGDPTISGYHGEVDYEDMADKGQNLVIDFAELMLKILIKHNQYQVYQKNTKKNQVID